MKILHISLNEYNSIDELQKAFFEMPENMIPGGKQLADCKEDAERNIKYQYEHFYNPARMFWYSKEEYNGVITYLMHECIFD